MSYTSKQAAEILGLQERSVTDHCLAGDLVATRHGRAWVISEDALDEFLAERGMVRMKFKQAREASAAAATNRPRGRPPKMPPG